tara:strand:- start:212 stop:490 length:279 start_codon:yes stop_codon:yes gene_type:complete
MKFEEIEKQVALRFEEIKKLTKERSEKENTLRKQIDKKLEMLMNGGFGKHESYKMLSGKVCDFRTLERWHTGTTLRPSSINKLFTLIEEEES